MATASTPDEEVNLRAQDLKRCNMCPGKERKYHAEFVCNTCDIDLCKQCVGEHLTEDNHDIVHFKFKSLLLCKHHQVKKCEHYCSECDIPVCMQCLASGSHAEHNICKITEICGTKRKKLLQHIKKIEADIEPGYERSLSEIDDLITKVLERKSKLQTLEENLHDLFKKVIIKYHASAKECETRDIGFLKSTKSKIEEEKRQSEVKKEECRKILSNNESADLISFKFKRTETKPQYILEETVTVPDFKLNQITAEQLLSLIVNVPPSLEEHIMSQENSSGKYSALSVRNTVEFFNSVHAPKLRP